VHEQPAATTPTGASSFDPGAAIALGALVLCGLSLLLPWYGITVPLGSRAFSASLHVSAGSGRWVGVAALFVATFALCLSRSLVLLVAAFVAGALAVAGMVVTVQATPAFQLPTSITSTAPATRSHLLGAALGILAAGLLAVGVVVHAITVLRGWRDARSSSDGAVVQPGA
jgi:hypothetical protein